MYRSYIITILLSFFCLNALCQRPMPVDLIVLKSDSILKESDLLTKYVAIENSLVDSVTKIKKEKPSFSSIITYTLNDKIISLFIGKDSNINYQIEANYNKLDSILFIKTNTKLNKFELDLFSTKSNLLKIASKSKLTNMTKKDFYYKYAFNFSNDYFNLYAISMTSRNDILPLDSSYIFRMKKNSNKVDTISLTHSKSYIDMNFQSNLLIINYKKSSYPLISSIDIFRFNWYKKQTKLYKFSAYCFNLELIYNSKSNKIKVR